MEDAPFEESEHTAGEAQEAVIDNNPGDITPNQVRRDIPSQYGSTSTSPSAPIPSGPLI